jgi:cell division protease FtsH
VVHKITIIPRGRAAGLTWTLPDEDRIPRQDWAEARIAHSLGGRAAEELVFEMISAGASDDIQKATELARHMVTRWGMSQLGPIALAQQHEQIFLGREISQHRDYSEKTAIAIDDEVARLIRESYDRAKDILSQHVDALHSMAKALLERETLGGDDVNMILKGEDLPPLAPPEPVEGAEPPGAPPSQGPPSHEEAPAPKGIPGEPGPDPAI